MVRKKILFISHEATLSGAPKLLLEIIKYISTHKTDFICDVLILKAGDLNQEFKKIATCYYPQNFKLSFFSRINNRLRKKYNYSLIIDICKRLLKNNYDIVYGNTITMLDWVLEFQKLDPQIKTILHIHEPKYLINLFVEKEKQRYLNKVDKLIVVSEFVKHTLIKDIGVEEHKIQKIYPFAVDEVDGFTNKVVVRTELGIKADELVMGCIGNPHFVKGSDLLPQIAFQFKNHYPDVKFKIIIVGGKSDNLFLFNIKEDIEKLDLKEHFIFISNTNEANKFLNVLDILLMISREESFSLVTLNAALSRIPVILFEKSGGPLEIISKENAYVARHLNINSICLNIYTLYSNIEKREQKLDRAEREAKDRFDRVKSCKSIINLLDNI